MTQKTKTSQKNRHQGQGRIRLITVGILAIVGLIVAAGTLFTVDETEFAVVKRFGEIQRVELSPGLKVKTPFMDQVVRLDNRLLHIDVPAVTMPDVEKQNLEIDAYVRYRIEDPKKFLQKLVSELTAASRLGNIVISEIRGEVARSVRSDIIGGQSQESVDPETGSIVRTVTPLTSRAEMMRRVLERGDAAVKSQDLGVTIVDVRIKAADFPQATEESIFTRMRTEREVQATRLRNEGRRQSLTIRADVDRQVTVILAEAERDANMLRGEGEGEAISILAGALEQDPEFFAFRRSLQAYKAFLMKNTTVIFSADSDLFKFLETPLIEGGN